MDRDRDDTVILVFITCRPIFAIFVKIRPIFA